MVTGSSDLVVLTGTLLFETDRAYRIDFGTDEPSWVPKSQVNLEEVDSRGTVEVEMPEWLAIEKGLI